MTHNGATSFSRPQPPRSQTEHEKSLQQEIKNLQRELYRRDVKIQNQDRIIQDLKRAAAEKHRSLEDRVRRRIWDENQQEMEQEVQWRVEQVRRECEEKLRKSLEPKPRFLDVESESDSTCPSPKPTSDLDFINVPETIARLSENLHYTNRKVVHLETSLDKHSTWIETFFKENASLVPNMLIHRKEDLPNTVQTNLSRLESIAEDVEEEYGMRQVLKEVNVEYSGSPRAEQSKSGGQSKFKRFFKENIEN